MKVLNVDGLQTVNSTDIQLIISFTPNFKNSLDPVIELVWSESSFDEIPFPQWFLNLINRYTMELSCLQVDPKSNKLWSTDKKTKQKIIIKEDSLK